MNDRQPFLDGSRRNARDPNGTSRGLWSIKPLLYLCGEE